MFKKLMMILATLVATMGIAFAQVDVNTADKAALDAVKGIGPVTSKMILDERTKGGKFKDWADFEARVKGVGDAKGTALSQAGLTISGTKKAAPTPPADKAATKANAKEVKNEATADAKAAKSDAKATAKDVKAEVKADANTAKASVDKDAAKAKAEVKKDSVAPKVEAKKDAKAATGTTAPATK